jgi:hypothetical protein
MGHYKHNFHTAKLHEKKETVCKKNNKRKFFEVDRIVPAETTVQLFNTVINLLAAEWW